MNPISNPQAGNETRGQSQGATLPTGRSQASSSRTTAQSLEHTVSYETNVAPSSHLSQDHLLSASAPTPTPTNTCHEPQQASASTRSSYVRLGLPPTDLWGHRPGVRDYETAQPRLSRTTNTNAPPLPVHVISTRLSNLPPWTGPVSPMPVVDPDRMNRYVCTRDADGSLRAPELPPTEQCADVHFLLYEMDKKRFAERGGSSARGGEDDDDERR